MSGSGRLRCSDGKMIRPSEVRSTLKALDSYPSRQLGQNFLIDRNILDILISQLELQSGEAILEIGPGLGAATEALLDAGCQVTAVEKDRKLAWHLDEVFGGNQRFELICDDILNLDSGCLLSKRQIGKIFSNLPYSSGTRILVDLVSLERAPERIVVTLQSEVARRIAACASTTNRGALSVWVQSMYDVTLAKRVSSACFWPRPEIESSIIRLDLNPMVFEDMSERESFMKLTKESFMHRRKQIGCILRDHLDISGIAGEEAVFNRCGIAASMRPEDLSNEQWLRLTRELKR